MTRAPISTDDLSVLSDFSSELANLFVLLAGDIALIVGQDGVILNVALGAAISDPSAGDWIGRHWADTVTDDTRRKIELLMQEVGSTGISRRREINHSNGEQSGIPISYAALRLGKEGPVIAVGRDLRTVSAIQQQMLKSQQEIERGYWALRRDQDQQRALQHVATDAVLMVEGTRHHVSKFNEAASTVLMQADGSICAQLVTLLTQSLHTGKAIEVRTRLKSMGMGSPLLDVFVAPFRGREPGPVRPSFLVRARQVSAPDRGPAELRAVVCDTQGRILMASDALVAMCSDADAKNLYGKFIGSVLGNGQEALSELLQLVLREGMAHVGSAAVGGHSMPACEAEVSATMIIDGNQERVGFFFRPLGTTGADAWTQSIEAALVSGQPLPEILQEVQTLAERHLVAKVLRSTSANLLNSADLLGISIDDLTQRLLRLGLDRAQYIAH